MELSTKTAAGLLGKLRKIVVEPAMMGVTYYLSPDAKNGLRASSKSNTLILFGDLASLCPHMGHMYQGFSTMETFQPASNDAQAVANENLSPSNSETLCSEELDLLVLNSNRTVINRAFVQDTLKRLLTFGLSNIVINDLCALFKLPTLACAFESDEIVQALMILRESGLSDTLTDEVCQFFKLDLESVSPHDTANVFEIRNIKSVHI